MATSSRRKVIRKVGFSALLIALVVVILTISHYSLRRPDRDPSTPHGAMVGHWEDTVTGTQFYVSGSSTWRVKSGEAPVRRNYEVTEENRSEFWLRTCSESEEGFVSCAKVTFSPDRLSMYTTTEVNFADTIPNAVPEDIASQLKTQIGTLAITTTYKRVDDETSP